MIYSIAPSPKDANLIWAGTDDGLIHVTRDGGKNWQNVTPPDLTPWSKVAQLDASHFDAATAYAAVNRFRLDDLHPYIYRTHDGGKTWQKIVNGLPDNEPVNTVREDPERKGLLFAGTERSVYVSFDDGDHWQSLRLNLPATSIRDLVVHGDDIVVGTHGRSFWILDNITPLRQIDSRSRRSLDAHLFAPQAHLSRPPQQQHRHAAAARRAAGPESARRRDDRLLARSRRRAGRPGDLRLVRQVVRRYSPATTSPSRSMPKELECSDVLGASRERASRPPPACTASSGICTIRRRTARTRISDLRDLSRHAALSARGRRVLPGTYTVKLTVDGENLLAEP